MTPRHDSAIELYKKARAILLPALEACGGRLLESLESANPYECRLALDRLAANREVMDQSWGLALVCRLVESMPLFDEHCAALVECLDGSCGWQGEELEHAHCNVTGGTSGLECAPRLRLGCSPRLRLWGEG
jgi:hypothetical protein